MSLRLDGLMDSTRASGTPANEHPKQKRETMVTTTDDLKRHPMYTPSDLKYFQDKGYSNEEILAFWNRDLAAGHEPLHHRAAPPTLEQLIRRIMSVPGDC